MSNTIHNSGHGVQWLCKIDAAWVSVKEITSKYWYFFLSLVECYILQSKNANENLKSKSISTH